MYDEVYRPDDELGLRGAKKARLFDNRVQVNADVYYIRWSNVQQLINQTCGYPLTQECRQCRVVRARVGDHRGLTAELTLNIMRRYTNEADERECHVEEADPALVAERRSEHPEIHREHGADLPEAVQR